MARRRIVQIDEQKCDGCGLCVPSCAEGALQVTGGKAKLVSETYCDGLGACLGECPQGAISVVEREAKAFDEALARQNVARLQAAGGQASGASHATPAQCPGTAAVNLQLDLPRRESAGVESPSGSTSRGPEWSALGNWPIQLSLVPPDAPFLAGADLLLVADCVPFAFADFHKRFLRDHALRPTGRAPTGTAGHHAEHGRVVGWSHSMVGRCLGRPVVIGCPKLDDTQSHVQKLAGIFARSSVNSVTVLHMEVPCCTGLVRVAEAALKVSGRKIPLEEVTISIRGKILNPGS